jgi:phosphatidylserine/phosphatidylglycerophosphate/cardiolipin synthase-like enzyme
MNPSPPSMVDAYFSPTGGCTDAWVTEILSTQHSFLVAAYVFTSVPIAQALIKIHQAGKQVSVIVDPSMAWSHPSQVSLLFQSGIPVLVDHKHHIFHNKYGVKDGTTVILGSFNLTTSAEKSNAENLVVLRVVKIAKVYLKNFISHQNHSIPFTLEPPKVSRSLSVGIEFGDEDGASAEKD